MTKLDIVKLAKATKTQDTTAKAIKEFFPGYAKETSSETCYHFAVGALDKHTMQAFLKVLKIK